ncbi:MAG: hypothetical protein MJ179_11845 [Treponema sp.]|nr:hypothetical protein [Treponema sp.]
MKKLFLSLLILNFSFLIFAMPGFKSYLPDSSGDFVYYRDYSFTQESYIGLLMYNESSFQVRYYAPQDTKNNLPERDISILVSINPSSDFWDMTGERLITSISNTPEEIDILNYLHDFLYEFSSRRIKAGNVSPENPKYLISNFFKNNGLIIKQDFPQFGGQVYLTFDAIIPFFNVKNIIDMKNNTLLECICFGKIQSSNDTTFSGFKGFTQKFKTNLEKLDKNTKARTFEYENLSVNIDSNWTTNYNFAQFKDEGIIVLSKLTALPDDTNYCLLSLTKSLCSSFQDSYCNLRYLEFYYNKEENQIKLIKNIYSDNNMIKGIEILTKDKNSNDFNYFYLSTFFHAYNTRRSYYDKIINSYKIN